MRYRPDLMRTKDGKFYFVGPVPASVAYTMRDGSPVPDDVLVRELRLPVTRQTITTRLFDTNKGAWNALRLASKQSKIFK